MRVYKGQIEGSYPGGKLQRAIRPSKIRNQIHGQVSVTESSKKTHEEYLQLHFILSLQSDRILVFETSIRRSNVVVQMSHNLPHLNFTIGEGPR